MQINDFYSILATIVRNYPSTQDMPCLRPQAFAVLQHIEQLNAQNIDKDSRYINSPYFYSRKFAERNLQNPSDLTFEFPLLVVMEGQSTVQNNQLKTQFDFFILDKMPQKVVAQMSKCSQRTIEQIHNDLKQMLLNVLASAKDFQKVSFDIGLNSYSGYYPMSWVRANATNIQIQGDSFDSALNNSQIVLNSISNFLTADLAACGGQIELNFVQCGTPITDYNFNNLAQTPQTGCC